MELNHEEEVPNISVGVVHVQPLEVDHYVLAKTHREDQHHNKFPDMHIVCHWGDAVTNVDYIQDSPSSQDNFGRSMTMTNSNLSNFSSNVIHDIQMLRLVSTEAQQPVELLSDSWSNMVQNDDSVDLVGNTNQPFSVGGPKKVNEQVKEAANRG